MALNFIENFPKRILGKEKKTLVGYKKGEAEQ